MNYSNNDVDFYVKNLLNECILLRDQHYPVLVCIFLSLSILFRIFVVREVDIMTIMLNFYCQ